MKKLPRQYKRVYNLLREGEKNATTSQEIASILNTDKRTVMGIIERLIIEYGCLIGSSRKGRTGYYIISNDEEFNKTANTYNRQIQSMMNRHRALIKAYSTHKG